MDFQYYQRDLEQTLSLWLSKREGVLIYGARQVGKSTLLKKIVDQYPDSRYLSFDDPNVYTQALENPQGFLLQISRGMKAIFIDEFQKVPEITLAVKYLYDSQADFPKIFMSGSISDSLTAGGDSMVGRVMRFPLYSLSFGEYLKARGIKTIKSETLEHTTMLTGEFDRYLQNGGYPATIYDDSQNLPVFFENLRRGFLEKDLLGRLRLGQIDSLSKLITILAKRVGSPISYNNLSNELGLEIKTIKNLLNILEYSYWIEIVRPLSKYGGEFKNKFKVYFLDTGLHNFLAPGAEIGFKLENCIFGSLKRNSFNPGFWHTYAGGEVDFIIEENGKTTAIEVKAGKMTQNKIPISLRNYILKYRPDRAIVVNKNHFGEEKIDDTQVHWLPAYVFAQLSKSDVIKL
ncbi:ATP-binding protein [Candidatus Amesbacteria bacterium]|nr:ATP-binding protein [Candidatus Amesbacteria bacterium]